jgi:microcystin degradation protein MlrC
LVIADGDATLAARHAVSFGHEVYRLRDTLLPHMPDIATALDLAAGTAGCVVLADTADDVGGGRQATT